MPKREHKMNDAELAAHRAAQIEKRKQSSMVRFFHEQGQIMDRAESETKCKAELPPQPQTVGRAGDCVELQTGRLSTTEKQLMEGKHGPEDFSVAPERRVEAPTFSRGTRFAQTADPTSANRPNAKREAEPRRGSVNVSVDSEQR
jgi:hypothetical protein